MKLGDDALLAIMGAMQKGILELVDISDLLKEIDLVANGNVLNLANQVQLKDVWSVTPAADLMKKS